MRQVAALVARNGVCDVRGLKEHPPIASARDLLAGRGRRVAATEDVTRIWRRVHPLPSLSCRRLRLGTVHAPPGKRASIGRRPVREKSVVPVGNIYGTCTLFTRLLRQRLG